MTHNKNLLLILVVSIIGVLFITKFYSDHLKNLEMDNKIFKQNQKLLLEIKDFSQKYKAIDNWQISHDDLLLKPSIHLFELMRGNSDKNILIIAYLDDILIKNHKHFIKLSIIIDAIKYSFLLETNTDQLTQMRKLIQEQFIINIFAVIAKITAVLGHEIHKIDRYNQDEIPYIEVFFTEGVLIDYLVLPPTYYHPGGSND